MRWSSDLRPIALAAAIALTVAAAAAAQTVETVVPAGNVIALEAGNGIGGGIDIAAGPVIALFSDGVRRKLVRRDGALALIDAFPRSTPPAAIDDMLPDGLVTSGREDIRRAWLTGPTGRYDHGILGDAIEASGLALERFDGTVVRYQPGDGSVFEDRLVRLLDLDRDGRDEAIVVQSFPDAGAALAVFALGPGSVRFVAAVPPIGMPHRWLNPAGAADFDGDGAIEIAFVETPHIGGTLKLYEFRERRLVADFAVAGFSNHAIGMREQFLSATVDWNGDGVADIVLPDARRRALRVISFAGGEVRELARVVHSVPVATAVLPARLDGSGDVAIVYGLADRTLVVLRP